MRLQTAPAHAGIAGWIALIGFLALFGFLAVSAIFGGQPEPTAARAFAACQEFVRARLVAPSQARFPVEDVRGQSFDLGDGRTRWVIAGAVDAPNRLGVIIRTNFLCSTIHDGSSWKEEYVTFGGS